MKKFYLLRFHLSKALILIAILGGWNLSAFAQTVTYSVAGTYSYTVGAGVTSLTVDMAGASGGNSYSTYGSGGKGGRVTCQLAVTPGQVLNVYVGGAGGNGPACCTYGTSGGFNGGGASQFYYGGSGGGASDIRIGGTALANRVVVAGGGGGAGATCSSTSGGDGGGLTGATGQYCSSTTYSTCYNGQGGSQTSGGAAGSCGCNSSGSLGQGGLGSSCIYAGGGGGGYYGGGGGYYAGGGGGSSYPASSGGSVTSLVHTQGYQVGNGYVTLVGPTFSTTTTGMAFGPVTVGSASAARTMTYTTVNLVTGGNLVFTTPSTDIQVSADGITWVSTLSIPITSSNMSGTLYVRFVPSSYSLVSGVIAITGGGIPTYNLPVNGTGVPACSGAPTTGTTTITPSSGGTTTTFNLGLSGTTIAGGLTYQWQSSLYSGGGFTNIAGATNATYTQVGISTNTYFRAIVSCGSFSSTSTPVLASVALSGASCTPAPSNASGSCTSFGIYVNAFALTGASGSISDAAACNSTGYNDRTALPAPTLLKGATYTSTVTTGTGNPAYTQVWIDFNGDGTFATTESVGYYTGQFTGAAAVPLVIPSGVASGLRRMRVVLDFYGSGHSVGNLDPCMTSYTYGEARDYQVIIQDPACSGTPAPTGTVSSDVIVGCGTYTANLLATGMSTAPGISYTWQQSTTSATAGFSDISGATNPYYTATVPTTTWYRLKLTCATGGATATNTAVQLISNTVPAAFTGSTNVCLGTPNTLATTTPGGNWTSSNTSIATVGASTGIVSGVAPGPGIITYTIPSTGCYRTANITVNTPPSSIAGGTNVCVGSTVALSDGTTGGTWSSSNTAMATVGSTSGVVTGVAAGSISISYTLSNGCSALQSIAVNPLPAAISGSSSVCLGQSTTLTDAGGGTWSSSNSFQASIGATTGLVNGVSVGTPTITYTLPTGCKSTLAMTVNDLPMANTGTMSVCVNGTTMLSNPTGPGTWTSGNTSLATVDASGNVTGVALGTPSISFTLTSTGCTTSSPVTVNGLPATFAVTGGGNYCVGGTGVHVGLSGSTTGVNYQLYEVTGGAIGSPMAGSSSGIDFGLQPAGTYTVQATSGLTSCVNNMTGSVTVNTVALPTPFNVTGGGSYCSGGAGVPITTDGSEVGVSYTLYRGAIQVGSAVAGTGSGISFGNQTVAGTYTAVALNLTTLCSNNMSGSADVIINSSPIVYSVLATKGGHFCSGSEDTVYISGSTPGDDYQLYRDGVAVGSTSSGTGARLDFPGITTEGVYTVSAEGIATGCVANMSGSATVVMDPLPAVYNVIGGGAYCTGGTGVNVGLDFSLVGVNYQLSNSGGPVGTPVAGRAGRIDFGLQTTPDTYTVTATSGVTGCSSNMAGSASVSVNPLPNDQTLTGGGGYCAGGAGSPVGLAASDAGIHYQLYNGTSASGVSVTGTGSAISFGNRTTPGTYSVIATDASTGCSSTMTATETISINPLPAAYTLSLSGSGTICAGSAGADIVLANSSSSVNYQLYRGSVAVGSSAPGTGGLLDFGPQAVAGVYTAIATDPSTTCSRNMPGSATVNVNPLPAVYTVSGGGNICAGDAGRHINLSLSNGGINYQLLNGGIPVGSPMPGTGSALDFGIYNTAGTYTIKATNPVTTCNVDMTGTSTITVNPLPTLFTVMGGGHFCEFGTGVDVSLTGSVTGVNYQLYNGSTATGAVMPGTGSTIDFGNQTAGGVYTVRATDATTSCAANMVASSTVTVDPAPAAFTVTGGGSYCASGTGVHLGLTGSNTWVTYQLHNDSGLVGSFIAGTGMAVDFGAVRPAGTYTVVATDYTTHCTNTMTGTAVISITPDVTPAVTLGGTTNACSGVVSTYSASAVNGGSSPSYTWKVNGVTAAATGSTYAYIPSNGDIVTVSMTSSAPCPVPATVSARDTIAVIPTLTPSVGVTASTATTICPGTSVTFTAAPTNGGTTPTYEWHKNGSIVAGTGSTYTYTPADNDVIFATMLSNYACRSTDFALSNTMTINVDAPPVPVFNILADPGMNIAKGQTLTLSADVTTAGSFTYQWSINGVPVAGASSATYSSNTFNNGDIVTAVVTSHTPSCGNATATHSAVIGIVNVGVGQVNTIGDVKVLPNPSKGDFVIKGSMGSVSDQEVTIEVTNMLGQAVYNNKITTHNGEINEHVQLNVANGMYLLNLRSGSDNKVFHVVVEQ